MRLKELPSLSFMWRAEMLGNSMWLGMGIILVRLDAIQSTLSCLGMTFLNSLLALYIFHQSNNKEVLIHVPKLTVINEYKTRLVSALAWSCLAMICFIIFLWQVGILGKLLNLTLQAI